MKKLVKVLAGLAVMFAAGSAFAKPAMYLKLTGGYDFRLGSFKFDYGKGYYDDDDDLFFFDGPSGRSLNGFNHFAVTPTFGMIFVPESDNGFLRGFGMELGLGVGIGKGEGIFNDKVLDLALIPRFDLVYHLLTQGRKFGEQKFVMHFMFGIEVPVFIPLKDTEYVKADNFFDVNLIGVGFDLKLTDKLDLVADMYLSMFFAFDLNVGIAYRF